LEAYALPLNFRSDIVIQKDDGQFAAKSKHVEFKRQQPLTRVKIEISRHGERNLQKQWYHAKVDPSFKIDPTIS
jgi:hypothetical protein